jgi:hypothetical protein
MTSPLLWPLHDDPRWRELETRLGVAPEQLKKIAFDPGIEGNG